MDGRQLGEGQEKGVGRQEKGVERQVKKIRRKGTGENLEMGRTAVDRRQLRAGQEKDGEGRNGTSRRRNRRQEVRRKQATGWSRTWE